MPPNQMCPICTRMVPDWHREWHTLEDQKSIFAGSAAMDCPFCSAKIVYANFLSLAVAEGGQRLAKRDVHKAAEWARNCDGKSLREYLITSPGIPYNRYWSEAEIRGADAARAANQE